MNLQKTLDPRFRNRWTNAGAMAPSLVALPTKNGAVRCPAEGCGNFMKKRNDGTAHCRCGTRARLP